MNTKKFRVVVAGGGTAGHIEPALAVAEALQQHYGAEVVALGTTKGLETFLVPERGFELRLIDPVPVPRKPSMDLLKLPGRVLKAVGQAKKVLAEHEADAVIGFGGYVSAPAYLAARAKKIPFFVHESNARAGMANKLGVALGGRGLNAVADSGLPGEVVGVPIRAGLATTDPAERAARAAAGYELFGLDPAKRTVLVTGGSQGARSINTAVAGAVAEITAAGFQVLHAVGKKNELPAAQPGYVPVPYISNMDLALAVADMVICRSGAMTVAETTAARVPAVYVPLPHGNGEQALNASDVVAAGAARLVADADLSPDRVVREVREILGDENTAAVMQAAAGASGVGDAARVIAEMVAEAVGVAPAQ
ncbi:undecaprenyldiphospho-muramoylpentapeptide beta-N-acetylglucosaminyltransferase [Corynebacterium aquilae]|uniref:UDP-N-acetylglucosamine--N-acetylmuramyl-(pentapeptide) pyrophosphoryl-undecaprenol N-acetylglucosamine transferase n=1 Tax=Corynebacterium aquilae DSM 44791 TaxID=1431546 RepID=A0A1L7CGY4_9CORY|nr:undecaprenyldiphospho-muramoylpentapeptide beta-N-acetylglucosaminyltransferase [Corynebacterium aquilae]APT85089.1 UDP-diphospho-muramoylpentapeptide beta-N-acetylglucosaminyltransferase [Corynebacterium aquilae DSM 44791]